MVFPGWGVPAAYGYFPGEKGGFQFARKLKDKIKEYVEIVRFLISGSEANFWGKSPNLNYTINLILFWKLHPEQLSSPTRALAIFHC